jgi:hypothetical protein
MTSEMRTDTIIIFCCTVVVGCRFPFKMSHSQNVCHPNVAYDTRMRLVASAAYSRLVDSGNAETTLTMRSERCRIGSRLSGMRAEVCKVSLAPGQSSSSRVTPEPASLRCRKRL